MRKSVFPVTAAHPDAANTLTINQHRHSTLHGRPSFPVLRAERKTDRMAHVEVLTGSSPSPWSGADLTRRTTAFVVQGVHGMKAGHRPMRFEQDDVPAGIHDRTGDRGSRPGWPMSGSNGTR